MQKFSAFLFLLFLNVSVFAQNIPLGTWRNHADYSNAKEVEFFNQKIFTATENALYYFDLEDGSLNTLSTADGLSSLKITSLNAINDLLLIGYEDGIVNILDSDLNISAFSQIFNSDIRTSKQINEVIQLEDLIYIATDFGIILYSSESNELVDAFTNLSDTGEALVIHHISHKNGILYLSTDEGLLSGDLNSNLNLKDFQNWKRYPLHSAEIGLRSAYPFNSSIYALGANDSIYVFENNNWNLAFGNDKAVQKLNVFDNNLYASKGNHILKFENGLFEPEFNVNASIQINDFVISENQYFLATELAGLVKYQNGSSESLIPQGPKGKPSSIHQLEEYTFSLSNNTKGFSFFENGRWNYVGKDDNENDLPIFRDVALDLISGNGIFLSETDGPYSWDTNQVSKVSVEDTTLSEWLYLAESVEGDYWALVRTSDNFYGVFNPQTQALFKTNLNSNAQINDYLIVPNGDHYVATNSGIYIFNPEIENDRRLNTILGNGNLPNNQILDLELALDGQLWIATNSGAAFFNSYQAVLTGESADASQPIFEGFFLFDGIPVNQIKIDGGNRKWMSTRDGLWLFDENINRNILHLRRDNSPIVDTEIRQMVVNPINGELFMISDSQFLSYRTDASRAGAIHSNVEVFPNPISASRNSRVTIRGLAYNNEVMITDMAGNLIHKGQANGGTFSWDLSNYSGFRLKPGVYLVFSINADGTETYQAKFALIP
ncbi:type IX secretion system anionic LPS delivery protein PorZ [Marivirga arenosa]|uniref:T9SS type A sorting domain-containing protein n=1 Tax=Marivirga arenosa TaxID=3059076 RepID=A0AA51ZWF9_9BACT|nr:T9SS type A sorting domain-containing protein [Marivirga sp. BKB1-2]WNB17986.1 T9SS type A sorting domain-containing protein [Marivirga sp. BKB1-2]